ncbi:MAG: CotH kinase family protein [Candidatus Fibromonas sp.]|nr:CotH kinase family protein [Candidatus Fibromonas sp.]
MISIITRRTIMLPVVIILFATVAAAELPVVKITTGTPAPSSTNSNYNLSSCANTKAAASNFVPPIQTYKVLTGLTITGAEDSRMNITANAATNADSIRIRGNSTSSMVPANNDAAKSYRLKFNARRSLFGMKESKSWALLANFYDPTQMLSAIGFELGKLMGLESSLPYEFVKLNYNGKDIGVYLLTPQVSGTSREGNSGVYLDEDNGGWLTEFTHWGPSDAEDCKRFFLAPNLSGGNGYKYVLNVKIRTPEYDELPLKNGQPDLARYDYVKSDINAFVNKLNESGFPNNGYRDLIDLRGWAIYTLINLFMDNRDWNTAGDQGGLGSNFLYKVSKSGKIMAGPLWDLDLAAGSPGVMGGTFFSNSTLTRNTTPSHAFYQKLWNDNSGFLPCYVEAWNANKAMIKAMGDNNGFIDQLMNKIAPSVNGNYAMREGGGASGTTYTEDSYKTFVGRMKSWWNSRYTNFDSAVQRLNATGTCPSATPPSSSSAARSSSSVASSSSARSSSSATSSSSSARSSSSIVASSSSGDNTPIAQNPLSATRSEIPTYYTIKGEPVGNTRPAKPGVYLVKQGSSVRKIVVR